MGLMELVNNFDIIENKTQNVKLIIVGGGSAFHKLKKLVISKKLESKVILTNFIPQKEIPKYISLADICINPFEINYVTNRILPTKIIEYFACGKPVLSTPLAGTKELLPDEKYGILYSDSQNFAKTLSTLILDKNRLNELGKLALDYAHKHHDWKILSQKLLNKFSTYLK